MKIKDLFRKLIVALFCFFITAQSNALALNNDIQVKLHNMGMFDWAIYFIIIALFVLIFFLKYIKKSK